MSKLSAKKPPADLDAPDDMGAPPPSRLSSRNNAQETPDEETAFHDQGERPAPTPESVSYHGENETCQSCEYYGEGNCQFLEMPVDAGAHCQRYEVGGEDADMGGGMPGEDMGGSQSGGMPSSGGGYGNFS